jgi:hypothetical protein
MQDAPNPRYKQGWLRCAGLLVVLVLLLAGWTSPKQPAYQDKQGFRFTPPSGWVERARGDALPAAVHRRNPNVPLPPLGIPGGEAQEQLLVRYDRLTSGKMAWLRVTAADLPSSMPLDEACLSTRTPGPDWRRESAEGNLEVNGLPAARIVFAGRWDEQDYLCETVAVRKAKRVYFITASFPSADATALEQVRQSVAGATCQ